MDTVSRTAAQRERLEMAAPALLAALEGLLDVCLDMVPDFETQTMAGVTYERYKVARIAAHCAIADAGGDA